MLLLRDSIVVLGLGVAGDAAVANAVGGGGGGSLFSFRGVAGGCGCRCACRSSRCRCDDGRSLGSGVDSLGLPAASDDGTLVRGRAGFAAGGGWPRLPRGVTGVDSFTFTTKLPPGFCGGLT